MDAIRAWLDSHQHGDAAPEEVSPEEDILLRGLPRQARQDIEDLRKHYWAKKLAAGVKGEGKGKGEGDKGTCTAVGGEGDEKGEGESHGKGKGGGKLATQACEDKGECESHGKGKGQSSLCEGEGEGVA